MNYLAFFSPANPTLLLKNLLLPLSFLFILPMSSCAPRLFMSQDSLDSFMTLKDQSLDLMKMATGSFPDHADEVASFKREMTNQVQEEVDRGEKNKKTVEMLNLLMDPGSNLLGGFLQRWEEKGTLSQAFVNEAVSLVSQNWQNIINMEQSKPTPNLTM